MTRRTRSAVRYARPSRARPRSPSTLAAALGWRRACMSRAARATAAKVAASSSRATSSSPAAASRPPTSGPPVAPAYRAVSTSPLASLTRSGPEATGTSANSAGCAIALPAPIAAVSTRIAVSESAVSAMAATAAACASDAIHSSRAFSKRSAIRPATPPSATTGPNSARKKAETASGEPLIASTCSASGIHSRKSPNADRPTAPTIRRTSRMRSTVMPRVSATTVLAPFAQRESRATNVNCGWVRKRGSRPRGCPWREVADYAVIRRHERVRGAFASISGAKAPRTIAAGPRRADPWRFDVADIDVKAPRATTAAGSLALPTCAVAVRQKRRPG